MAPTRINGRLHGLRDIMVRPGSQPFDLLTPDHHSLYGIVVQSAVLQDAAQRQGCRIDWPALCQTEVLQVQEAARAACVQALERLLPRAGLRAAPSLPAAAQDSVLNLLLSLLDSSQADGALRRSAARRHQLVARARDYVLAHPDRPVGVPELCEHLHLSRRSLQYGFEAVLGLSPVQYLRAIRLNGVRRQLRQANRDAATVQDIAAHWGFWHLSQFGCDYRKLFGETPSETLRQPLRA